MKNKKSIASEKALKKEEQRKIKFYKDCESGITLEELRFSLYLSIDKLCIKKMKKMGVTVKN